MLKILGVVNAQIGLWKWRDTYHFLENSAYFVFSNSAYFEDTVVAERVVKKEEALKDSYFWWVAWPTWYYDLYIALQQTWLTWHEIWFGIYISSGGVWLNGIRQNRETDEEHDEDCLKEGFQIARVKFDRDVQGEREALGIRKCSINILDGSELELAWPKKSSLYFENNFPMFLFYLVFLIHRFLRCVMFCNLSKFISNEYLLQYFL